MTSKQIRIVAIVLLALAALLALLAWQVGRRTAKPPAPPSSSPSAMHAVVITTKAVEAGKPLAADALKVEMLPIDPTGGYQSLHAVVGQIPVVALGANVPVLESQLAGGLASQVPEGERAVAIAVDEVIGVGHRVRPGDLVDVFLVLRRDSQEIEGSQARLLLSRLRVLAYGVQAVNDTRGAGPDQMMNRREGAKTAVLTVPLAQVSKLTMAQQAGRLVLALRNPHDDGMPSETLFAEPAPAVATRGGGLASADALEPADRAAAGVALAGLAGSATRPRAPAVRPEPPQIAQARPAAAASPTGVEVIRAGKRAIE